MRRKRAFTVAETLTAGSGAIIVGGISIAAFLGTSTASSMANLRHYSSKEMYRVSVSLRKDIEQGESFEIVSSSHLKLNVKDPTTGVVTVTEYKLTTNAPIKVQRIVGEAVDPLLQSVVESMTFTKINDGCVSYLLRFAANSSQPSVQYKGEVRLRNWIKK